MLDHVILPVRDIAASVAFHTATLAPSGITVRVDSDGKDGPAGRPDLKGATGPEIITVARPRRVPWPHPS